MSRTTKKQDNKQTILWGVIAALVIICGILTIALSNKTTTSLDESSPSVSLGPMQYKIVDGKAVKRDDAPVNSLKSFLDKESAHAGCSAEKPAYEHVVAYSKDETQVFLKYGCAAADSPMYAIKINEQWKPLSPTNHFDYLGLPDCKYVADNNISKEIAPVCANEVVNGVSSVSPNYLVR